MTDRPRVAIFRPSDDRTERAVSTLDGIGLAAVVDPMVEPEPTGAVPRSDAEVTVFTSSTAASILADRSWSPADTEVAAIGPRTATALTDIGIDVDHVPDRYESSGLVECLEPNARGQRIEVARSDHGSETLLTGLHDAGAYVHETVLYRLERPADAGTSVEALGAGTLDALAFSSSLTVRHFMALAQDRLDDATRRSALDEVVVGAIGQPTATTARDHGLAVDVIAPEATFDALARAIVDTLHATGSRHV